MRLGHADTGTEAAHHFDPVEFSVGIHCRRRPHRRRADSCATEGRGPAPPSRMLEEYRRRDADHREESVIDENRLSNRIRRSSKTILASRETDDGDRRCAWTVVFGSRSDVLRPATLPSRGNIRR